MSRMTDEEWRVLNLLVEATRAFMGLPEHHPSDKAEWAVEVHHLQQRVMCRMAVREYPDVFTRMRPSFADLTADLLRDVGGEL